MVIYAVRIVIVSSDQAHVIVLYHRDKHKAQTDRRAVQHLLLVCVTRNWFRR